MVTGTLDVAISHLPAIRTAAEYMEYQLAVASPGAGACPTASRVSSGCDYTNQGR